MNWLCIERKWFFNIPLVCINRQTNAIALELFLRSLAFIFLLNWALSLIKYPLLMIYLYAIHKFLSFFMLEHFHLYFFLVFPKKEKKYTNRQIIGMALIAHKYEIFILWHFANQFCGMDFCCIYCRKR